MYTRPTRELMLLEKVLEVALTDKPLNPEFPRLAVSSRELRQFPRGSLSTHHTSFIDTILVERCKLPETEILEYLANTYARVKRELAKPQGLLTDKNQYLLTYVAKILGTYATLSLTQEDSFPQQKGAGNPVERLFAFIEGLTVPEFLARFADAWEDLEAKNMIFTAVIERLLAEVLRTTIIGKGLRYLTMLRSLVSLPGVSELILDMNWLPSLRTGSALETETVLGPFFALSYCPRVEYSNSSAEPNELRDAVFSYLAQAPSELERSWRQEWYCGDTARYVEGLLEVSKRFLCVDKTQWLNWVRCSIKMNWQSDAPSSNGFLFNVLDVLLALCQPIVDSEQSEKINPRYLQSDPTFAEEPTLGEEALFTIAEPQTFGKTTEYYFLCMKMLRVAWTRFSREFQAVECRVTRLQGQSPKQEYLKQLQASYEIFVKDLARNTSIKAFYVFSMTLILQWMGFANQLDTASSTVFGLLPEHLLEDINQFFYVCLTHQTNFIQSLPSKDFLVFLTFGIAVVSNPTCVKHPELRVSFARNVCLCLEKKACGDPVAVISSDVFVNRHIMLFLVRFYVDTEDSSYSELDQYEDRHAALTALDSLWQIDFYRSQFCALAGSPHFVQFLRLLLKEASAFLSRGLKGMTAIKSADWEARSKVISCMLRQGNDSVAFLLQVSEWIAPLLLQTPLKPQVIEMLSQNLQLLCGSHCFNVKFSDLSSFKPEELLRYTMLICLNLSQHSTFLQSLDTKTLQAFRNAGWIAQRCGLLLREQVNQWALLVSRLVFFQREQQPTAPQLFLCPLSQEVMKNPVYLPTSGVTVDRTSIERYLLSVSSDPFNGKPLTLQQLAEDIGLRYQIERWLNVGSRPRENK